MKKRGKSRPFVEGHTACTAAATHRAILETSYVSMTTSHTKLFSAAAILYLFCLRRVSRDSFHRSKNRLFPRTDTNMGSKGNAEVNYVHQNAILCETIKKEQRNHKLYTNYSINPFKKSKLWSHISLITGTIFALQAFINSMFFL